MGLSASSANSNQPVNTLDSETIRRNIMKILHEKHNSNASDLATFDFHEDNAMNLFGGNLDSEDSCDKGYTSINTNMIGGSVTKRHQTRNRYDEYDPERLLNQFKQEYEQTLNKQQKGGQPVNPDKEDDKEYREISEDFLTTLRQHVVKLT